MRAVALAIAVTLAVLAAAPVTTVRYVPVLTSRAACAAIEAAVAAAGPTGQRSAVAVVDGAGHLNAFARMDGAGMPVRGLRHLFAGGAVAGTLIGPVGARHPRRLSGGR